MTNRLPKKDKGVIKLKVNKSSKNGFSNVVLTAISQGLLWAIMAIRGLHYLPYFGPC